GLAAALLRREPGELTLIALSSPCGEIRRVEPFPAQQCPDQALSTRGERFVRLPDDTEFVLRREGPALRALGRGGSLRIPRPHHLPDRGGRPLARQGGTVLLGHVLHRG